MDSSPRISTLPPDFKSQDFGFLRSEGLDVIQQLAAHSWTDHNVHDPGITLLEALCYAMTEGGLRAGMDIKDLIASSRSYHTPDFFTASQVLPSSPITVIDFRKVLIDHLLVRNAWFFPLKTIPLGSYSVLLEFADADLNSNNFVEFVTVPGPPATDYTIDIAFPHWDDEDVMPLREDVTLLGVTFDGAPGNEWNEIDSNTSFFTRVTVDYQPSSGPAAALQLWVMVHITSGMEDPFTEAPLVLGEVTALISDLADDRPLKKLNERVKTAHEAMRLIRRYASGYRNLCEDMVAFNAVRQQEIGVSAIIEVSSGVNVEELLADIFYRIHHFIAPSIRFDTLEAQMQQLGSADAVFDGPLTNGGFAGMDTEQIKHVLYTSDILRLIYQLRNDHTTADVVERENINERKIVGVRNLSLANYLDNRPISTRARDCLQLVKSQRHIPVLSVTKSHIAVFRNGVEVIYDQNRVLQLFNDKKVQDATQQGAWGEVDLPLPSGEAYPVAEHYPIQNDLPLVYGAGEVGLPEHATVARQAQAKQLKGYLFFFEQLLAGFQMQLAQFNAFFSADHSIGQTLFQQPLYQLPHVAPLFKAWNPQSGITWQEFVDDEANAYRQVLRDSIEDRTQFLDRRHAVLDHLLASLGEEMQDRATLLLRLANQVPDGESLPLPVLLDTQRQRRLDTLEDLLQDKSTYYYQVSELNSHKAQAFRYPSLVHVFPVADGYGWQITDGLGTPLFQQVDRVPFAMEAAGIAKQVLKLATEPTRYTSRVESGGSRLEIRATPLDNPLGEATDLVPDADVADAIVATAAAIRECWLAGALMPLESRLYHLLGIHLNERRPLVHSIGDYVAIYDDPVPNPDHRKRFRLHALPGLSGDILLESVDSYAGGTDEIAIDAALEGAQLMFDVGVERRNYTVTEIADSQFQVTLAVPGNGALAHSETIFNTMALAESEITRINTQLFRLFSVQGLYIVEHRLLFPQGETDTALHVPGWDDPYSFQLTVIFPSGYARDFSQPDSLAISARPALYRNREFRKYAEEQVRKHCPVHILPRILWVDTSIPGTSVAPDAPCMDTFEAVYFNWLAAYMTDEADASVIEVPRNALTGMLNALYEEYYMI